MSKTTTKKIRQKQRRVGVYEMGRRILFVPTEEMSLIREACKQLIREGCQPTVRDIERSAVRTDRQRAICKRYPRSVTDASISHWRRKFSQLPWFESWLLRGDDPPPDVTVATVNQVERSRKGFDWISHCGEMNPAHTYRQWIKRRIIPSIEWLKWLYGGPAPEGVYVVPERLVRLRRELSTYSTCRAADVDQSLLCYYRRKGHLKSNLEKTVTVEQADDRPFSPDLPLGIRARLTRLKKAGTLSACCKRAGFPSKYFYMDLVHADSIGAKAELERFVCRTGQYDSRSFDRIGLIGEKLFVPSPGMWAFRNRARAAMAENKVWYLRDILGFEQWFLDWTIPRPKFGHRPELSGTDRDVARAARELDLAAADAARTVHAVPRAEADPSEMAATPDPPHDEAPRRPSVRAFEAHQLYAEKKKLESVARTMGKNKGSVSRWIRQVDEFLRGAAG